MIYALSALSWIRTGVVGVLVFLILGCFTDEVNLVLGGWYDLFFLLLAGYVE